MNHLASLFRQSFIIVSCLAVLLFYNDTCYAQTKKKIVLVNVAHTLDVEQGKAFQVNALQVAKYWKAIASKLRGFELEEKRIIDQGYTCDNIRKVIAELTPRKW